MKHTERLAEVRIEPSVGSVGDSYDCEKMGTPIKVSELADNGVTKASTASLPA